MSNYKKLYLGLGPMSQEIIQATVQCSHELNSQQKDFQLMFVCSENQVNRDRGYTGFTTKEFSHFVNSLEGSWNQSNVWKCRDHCGPGFFYKTVDDCVKTVEDDIANGFDLIHIDTCYLTSLSEKLGVTKEMMESALKKNDNIKFEIGTEVNSVKNKLEPKELKSYLEEVSKVRTPFFYVLETNAVVEGYNNSGLFAPCEESLQILSDSGVKCKEHNADYLTKDQVSKRSERIKAMNVAPQFGVLQTATTLAECFIYGINTDAFKQKVFEGGKWEKWKVSKGDINPDEAVLLAGHYHFQNEEYKNIMLELSKHTNISELIIEKVKKLIYHYVEGYDGH